MGFVDDHPVQGGFWWGAVAGVGRNCGLREGLLHCPEENGSGDHTQVWIFVAHLSLNTATTLPLLSSLSLPSMTLSNRLSPSPWLASILPSSLFSFPESPPPSSLSPPCPSQCPFTEASKLNRSRVTCVGSMAACGRAFCRASFKRVAFSWWIASAVRPSRTIRNRRSAHASLNSGGSQQSSMGPSLRFLLRTGRPIRAQTISHSS